ncbi:glycosyltransferase [Fulvivirgaceae bacterium BMA10]|uniref:Glycosyltransferase n=1 Tax=Splendidivirga corallicola TaxID=3051826 RepID=A0ABT8KTZ0_9BACT|nr:glycosyltransferase [Fulvivirgaceae bacterium BMA10]
MSSKIRILYTIPNFDTAGSGQVLLGIAKNLDPSIFEVHICCNHDRGEYFKKVVESGIKVHIGEFTAPLAPKLNLIPRVLKVARFFKKINPDIVHSFHWSSDFTEALAAKLAGAKWIYTKKNMSWGNKSWKIRSSLANGIVTINPFMKELYFPKKKQVKLVPCSVDQNRFKPGKRNDLIREELGFKSGDKLIICIAAVLEVKGIDKLIEAFEQLPDSNYKLILLGDKSSEYAEELILKVQDKQLDDRIKFLGKKSNVEDYLLASDLFVLPTRNIKRSEALGVALLEAMASGILAIGSDIYGIKFILQDFPELLYDPEDPKELATKIQDVLDLPEEKKSAIKTKFSKIIEERFSVEKEVQDHESFYKGILGKI